MIYFPQLRVSLSPHLLLCHPISLSPHLPILILTGRASFFMDNTVSSYLSLIHNSRPDTDVSALMGDPYVFSFRISSCSSHEKVGINEIDDSHKS